MKKLSILFCSVLILTSNLLLAQSEEVLLTINDHKILKEEFVRIYEKNKTNLSTGEITSVDDYLDLFVNFKLKVIEAEKLGYDTLPSFVKEFEGYKKQLARPYLLDNQKNEEIIKEAYERMQTEVRASHILVEVEQDALPEDTAQAYEKAMEIRRRILQGEAFEVVAKGSSDDPSVKNNGGDLGYFTVFQMIYPFENAVYNTKVGEISMPVRTRYGYHIIQVTDKRKARGEVKVAHIMLTVPRDYSKEEEKQNKVLINELYHRIKQGEDFAELAKEYSEDRGSARKGGELPWFSTGRMVKEFEDAAFALSSIGEVSQPVRTGFGWHLIKLLDKKEIPDFKDAKSEIKQKVGKDRRSEVARYALIEKLKDEYNFKEKTENIPAVYDTLAKDYVLKQEYINPNAILMDTLFTFLDKVFMQKDFVMFINKQKADTGLTPYQYSKFYNEFIDDKILEVEESILEEKYKEYKYLLKEYHDGMLLFEITDDMVWSKAVNDSVGLKDYYKKNRKKYMWDERWKGSIYECSDKNVCNKVAKIISKRKFGRKTTNDDLIKQFNNETEELKITTATISKGENKYIDKIVWNKGNANTSLILTKGEILQSTPKPFEDARGAVISDYQDYLEKEWIKKLREKYNIQVNQDVLSSIK